MKDAGLRAQTEAFVDTLNSVVAASIDTDIRFGTTFADDEDRARIEPVARAGHRLKCLPLSRPKDDRRVPALLLVAYYRVELGNGSNHLRVAGSTVGLWVDITGGR